MKGHVALIAIAEILPGVFGPLIGLGQQHAGLIFSIHFGANELQYRMRFRQILVIGTFAFDQIGYGIKA